MFALRNAASVARKKAGFNCEAHGVRHGRRILAAVDGAGEEDTGAAELHGAGDDAVVSDGGEHQHAGRAFPLLQLGEHAQPVHSRHDDVQQHDVRLLRGGRLKRGDAVFGLCHEIDVLICRKLLREALAQGGVVIHKNQANASHVTFLLFLIYYIVMRPQKAI